MLHSFPQHNSHPQFTPGAGPVQLLCILNAIYEFCVTAVSARPADWGRLQASAKPTHLSSPPVSFTFVVLHFLLCFSYLSLCSSGFSSILSLLLISSQILFLLTSFCFTVLHPSSTAERGGDGTEWTLNIDEAAFWYYFM